MLSIWNQLDEVGLYQSLQRLDGETDEQFYARIKKFAKWRCKTDYYTQAHTIPIQAGLSTYPVLAIDCDVPFELNLDWEYFIVQTFPTDGRPKEYARVFININDSVIDKITNTLSRLPSFKFQVLNPNYRNLHHRFIIRMNSVSLETDFVGTKGCNLSHKNILEGSLRTEATSYCNERKSSLLDLKKPGDYFLDCKEGYIQTFNDVTDGYFVSYRKFLPRVVIEGTELNLIPMNTISKYGITDDMIQVIPYILNGKTWGP